MLAPSSLLSLASVLVTLLTKSTSQPQLHEKPRQKAAADWFGTLPPSHTDPMVQGSLVSACTFAVGPPGPSLALCPAFLEFCHAYKESRSPHTRILKTRPLRPLTSSPLDKIRFRAGCTGGSDVASDGTYISGYTASCVVDGTEWVSLVC